MTLQQEKYNDTTARNVAALILQNKYNPNLGINLRQAMEKNFWHKANVDFWLAKLGGDT